MAEGKIPYSPTFYSIAPQTEVYEDRVDNGITTVSPTEQQIQIAQSEVKQSIKRKAVDNSIPVKRKKKTVNKKNKRTITKTKVTEKQLPKKFGGK